MIIRLHFFFNLSLVWHGRLEYSDGHQMQGYPPYTDRHIRTPPRGKIAVNIDRSVEQRIEKEADLPTGLLIGAHQGKAP